ncbi:hypothetical protein D1872_293500 [compost metagenome]
MNLIDASESLFFLVMNVPANPSPVLTTFASFDKALGSILNVNEPPPLLILMLSESAAVTV